RLKRELRKIRTNLGGVRKMGRLPGAVIVVDARKEHLALREARKLGIPSIGIIDTDSDPDEVDVAIPANDDSIKAIEILLSAIADAVNYGKANIRAAGAGHPARGRSRRKTLASADDGGDAAKVAPRRVAVETEAKGEAVKASPEAGEAAIPEATPEAAPEAASEAAPEADAASE
ncbi:MAG: 30S ribosomal protein S2, partial [Planctomycetes bacterium]|nr:30S ribosomal protein S2 [Planctomycetota bacterium]